MITCLKLWLGIAAGCAICFCCLAGCAADAQEKPDPAVGELSSEKEHRVEELVRRLIAEEREQVEKSSPVVAGYRNGFFIRSEDDLFSMRIGGRIQARYEYWDRPGKEDISTLFLRRVRLDFRGHVFDKNLTYRIMPELSRTAVMRDAYINYAFSPTLELRAGQQPVRFDRQQEISSSRNHFAERGQPAVHFASLDASDVGVSLHGMNRGRTQNYSVGVYNGLGRNKARGDKKSTGHLFSARSTRALLGKVPNDETDFRCSTEPNLAVAVGVQTSYDDDSRSWALGRSSNNRADYNAGTSDVHFAYMGFSLGVDGYLRRVQPDASDLSSYTGDAFLVTAGYALIPDRLELVSRYSEFRLDRDDRDTRHTEIGGGVNIYHRGHNWKTRVNYFSRNTHERTGIFLVELHLMF